jgi:spore maturation protein CgeB
MRLAIFGLSISSSWGNGHATLWRGLCRALVAAGHEVTFFERDVPWYANARDWAAGPGAAGDLVLYADWSEARPRVVRELRAADVAVVTSFCPDALAARDAILDDGGPVPVFYDLDSPVTLERLASGEDVPWVDGRGYADYSLVLSYAGGPVLAALEERLDAKSTAPLYGHVDPDVHRPVPKEPRYAADLCWLGTWAADRQAALDRLFLAPARAAPGRRFLIAGAQYPPDFPWGENVWFIPHLPPPEHAAFLCSARLALNVTRASMAATGWCPSGRLFEASACGATLLTDTWPGLEAFYRPGLEILTASAPEDTLAALARDDAELARIGRAARERTLDEHTSAHRAGQLIAALERAARNDADRSPRRAARSPGEARRAATPVAGT